MMKCRERKDNREAAADACGQHVCRAPPKSKSAERSKHKKKILAAILSMGQHELATNDEPLRARARWSASLSTWMPSLPLRARICSSSWAFSLPTGGKWAKTTKSMLAGWLAQRNERPTVVNHTLGGRTQNSRGKVGSHGWCGRAVESECGPNRRQGQGRTSRRQTNRNKPTERESSS